MSKTQQFEVFTNQMFLFGQMQAFSLSVSFANDMQVYRRVFFCGIGE